MLVVERQREIAAIVDKQKSVRVSGLAQLFRVTEETIRRDLEKLETEGKLLRSHGGAVAVTHGGREASFSEREVSFVLEKTAIARAAIGVLEDGDTILMDASTTAWQITRLLPDLELTVLTNAMKVCAELAGRPRVRVVCTGGSLSAPSLSFVGPRAEQALREYHVNRLFISCTGVDFEHGLSDVNEAQAVLKRHMMDIADRVYLLVDPSKFGVKALKRFADLADIHEIITNQSIPAEILEQLQSFDLSITLAK